MRTRRFDKVKDGPNKPRIFGFKDEDSPLHTSWRGRPLERELESLQLLSIT